MAEVWTEMAEVTGKCNGITTKKTLFS